MDRRLHRAFYHHEGRGKGRLARASGSAFAGYLGGRLLAPAGGRAFERPGGYVVGSGVGSISLARALADAAAGLGA